MRFRDKILEWCAYALLFTFAVCVGVLALAGTVWTLTAIFTSIIELIIR